MLAYPLLFTYRGVIEGRGYTASVELDGGAVVTVEKDGIYLAHGLRPGGICGEGQDLLEAYFGFKSEIQVVIRDLANEERDIRAFKTQLLQFFNDSDPWAEDAFQEARKQMRDGHVEDVGLRTIKCPNFEARISTIEEPQAEDDPPPPTVLPPISMQFAA